MHAIRKVKSDGSPRAMLSRSGFSFKTQQKHGPTDTHEASRVMGIALKPLGRLRRLQAASCAHAVDSPTSEMVLTGLRSSECNQNISSVAVFTLGSGAPSPACPTGSRDALNPVGKGSDSAGASNERFQRDTNVKHRKTSNTGTAIASDPIDS